MANLADEYVPGRYRQHDLLRAYAAEQARLHRTRKQSPADTQWRPDRAGRGSRPSPA
jgi:hypothetical protein